MDVCVHQLWSLSVDLMIKHISTHASWSRSPAEPGVWGVSTRSMLVHVDKSGRKEPGITCTRSRFTLNQSVKIIYNNLIIICGSSNNSSFWISITHITWDTTAIRLCLLKNIVFVLMYFCMKNAHKILPSNYVIC